MDVVGHETPPEHPHAGFFALVPHEVQIGLPICLREKDIGAIDASLGDVIGDLRKDASWVSRHIRWCPATSEFLSKCVGLLWHFFEASKKCKFRLTRFPTGVRTVAVGR